jgi:hypothetical protein
MVALQAWLARLGNRSTNGSTAFKKRRGMARTLLEAWKYFHFSKLLEACACARTLNYIIKSADVTVQR